jgi:hypothetical protein
MALKIDMCRLTIDMTGTVVQIAVGVSDTVDFDLKKSKVIRPTFSSGLTADIKNEVNAALTAEGLPTLP